MPADCPTCGKTLATERGMRVHHWRSHDSVLDNQTCDACDDSFYAPHERKYCSDDCRTQSVSRAGERNPNYRGTQQRTACQLCGDDFRYYPSEKAGIYCPSCVESASWRDPPDVTGTANPRWTGGKRRFDCAVCETAVERYPSQVASAVLCSEACRKQWLSDTFTGPGHPNWKGGENVEYGRGWRETRRAALERDDYRCRLCGATRDELGRNPDVHHIVPVRWFRDADDHSVTDAHTLDNVLSLCIPCHRRAEHGHVETDRLRELIGVESRGKNE